MLKSLADVLKIYGLELDVNKTKILSSIALSNKGQVCITEHAPINILFRSTHQLMWAFSWTLKYKTH